MTDWLDGSPDTSRYGGQAESTHALTGRVWQRSSYDAVPPAQYDGQAADAGYGGYGHRTYAPMPEAAADHGYGGEMVRDGSLGSGTAQDGFATGGAVYDGFATGGAVYDGFGPHGGLDPYEQPGPQGATGGPLGGPTRTESDGAGSRVTGVTRSTRPPARTPSRSRRIMRLAGVLGAALLMGSAGTYVWADTRLDRDVKLDNLAGRAPLGKGTNYLIVGSDSRAGLSQKQLKDLHTGGSADAGRRTDSMLLLHTGAHGTTMVSLPRDSWVTIPPFIRPETGRHYRASKNKLNAAFSLGGPELLSRTIEHNTGLHIDHYTEIGFAGFVNIVDAVGGVPICIDRNIKDEKSGADLTKGCHTLNGHTALAFVRQRHQEAQGDLGRGQNQQKFLAALAHKAATPGVLLDPTTVFPTAAAGLDTLIVDDDMSLVGVSDLFEAMQKVSSGNGKRLTVPVASLGLRTSKGSAVKWDLPAAKRLFAELREDRRVSVKATAPKKG
ncbi:LCP family protein [Streptomyces sp. NPDC058773]|uniref:LCP family protein n=1 Tax=Streptomyces sp. NPDC058773 TaxID=3346632 RepID=UPI003690023C